MRLKIIIVASLLILVLLSYGLMQSSHHPPVDFNEGDDPQHILKMADRIYQPDNPDTYSEAFNLYLLAAEAGSAIGAHNVGMMYLDGQGVEQNGEHGRKWLAKAADWGERAALAEQALESLRQGDNQQARQLFNAAYQKGETNILPHWVLLLHSLNQHEDAELKLQQLQKFHPRLGECMHQALQGDPKASMELADLLMEGTVIRPSDALAKPLLETAAKAGMAKAMIYLGQLARNENNASAADEWLIKAAKVRLHHREETGARQLLEEVLKYTPSQPEAKQLLLTLDVNEE